MALNKKLFNTASEDTITPSQHFETVLYKGNGGTQKVGSHINAGLEFNGTSTRVDLSGLNSFFGKKQTFSVSAWVNCTASGNRSIFDDYNGANQNIGLYFYDGTINFFMRYNNTDVTGLNTGSTTYYNDFHHVVATSDQTTAKLYVDGSLVASASVTSQSYSGGSPSVGIGRQAQTSAIYNYFSGVIDQVRVFNKAISSTEVTTLYNETYSSTSKSVTDIFSDRSAIALYQFENSAKDTGGASGYYGEGAIFNGSSSHIDIPSPIPYTNTDFSFTGWFYLNSSFGSGYKTIIGAGDKTNGEGIIRLLIRYSSSNNYTIEPVRAFSGNSYYTATSNYTAQTINEKTWFHIVYTYTASSKSANIYLNGSLVSSTNLTTTSTDATNSGVLALGQYRDSSSGYWDGKIDEVRIYSDVLTSTEIGHIYNNTTASIPTDNLEAYYKFEDNAQDEQQQYDGVSSNVIYRYDGSGNDVSFQGSTNFAPDFIWTKMISSGNNHQLFDRVRGVTKELESNTTAVEVTNADSLTSFNSNGFTVGSSNNENQDGVDYIAWCWKGGGAAVSNTDGSIASSVSVNNTTKFSIVTWTSDGSTGLEVGHGLGVTPKLLIYKRYSGSTSNWTVYTNVIDGSWDYLRLNGTQDKTDESNTIANSTLIRNVSTAGSWIAYCFDDVTGFQKIGTYTGNNSSNGPIVETGFEVGWLMLKRVDDTSSWVIVDNKRDRTNPRTTRIFAETSDANSPGGGVDFLTNGFRISANSMNNDGGTYLYWAIATDPSTAATPTVTKSFDVVTYEGNGGTQDIESDINPDLVWVKRTSSTEDHVLFDTVRGVQEQIRTNSDGAQSTKTNALSSFNEKGFTTGANNALNTNGQDYVAFLWSAGSHEGNLPSANTDGNVKSTTSVNAAAGFSVSRVLCPSSEQDFNWGHGLGAKPDMVLMKKLNSSGHWFFWHKNLTAEQNYLYLNSNLHEGGLTQDARIWGNQTFTSTTVSTRSNYTFSNDDEVICYCWKEISGSSKIGTYVSSGATGSSNQITVGFKPRFLLVKSISNSEDWYIFYSLGIDINGNNDALIFANKDDQQNTSYDRITFSSTGFYWNTAYGGNSSGYTYIYYAVK